jgi:D-3-phosphoglycerate dehydrogenase / 2-oxoglutarate reductase
MKPLLLVLDDWEGLIAASPYWAQVKDMVDLKFLHRPIAEAADAELINVHFLMAIRERTALTEEVFARLPKLKLVLQTGGHAYHVDQAAAEKRGIAIALGRRIKAPLASVPELTMAFMLGLMHLIPQAQHAMRAGEWPLLTGRTLKGRRLGILGIGRHGGNVARIAKTAFGMEVVAWDRPGSANKTMDDVPRLGLDELLKTSDVVSIHLRLSPESNGLVSSEKLQLMKKGSILINTARGAIVDEAALIDALTYGPLAGAGLDVFTDEPLTPDSILRKLNNVMLTPHVGWTVEEVFEEFTEIACTQVAQFLSNSLPESELLAAH